MSQKSKYLLKIFLLWVIANILGICAGMAVLFLSTTLIPSIHSAVLSIVLFSIPISLAQWLALRRISHLSILWVLTAPMGILIYFLLVRLIPNDLWQSVDDESILALTAAYLAIGFAIGLLQWLILRRHLTGSSLWILGSTIGLGFSLWFILATDLISRSGFISTVIGIGGYIIITGLILLRLNAHTNHSDIKIVYTT